VIKVSLSVTIEFQTKLTPGCMSFNQLLKLFLFEGVNDAASLVLRIVSRINGTVAFCGGELNYRAICLLLSRVVTGGRRGERRAVRHGGCLSR
jgi:hypothetical protein